jgi:hypothetical protein
LRFIGFDYNQEERAKLEQFAEELGFDFEAIKGVGNPLVRPHVNPLVKPHVSGKDHYENRLKSYRSEGPHDAIGKVCPLIFGQVPIDANGNVYLCCEVDPIGWTGIGLS